MEARWRSREIPSAATTKRSAPAPSAAQPRPAPDSARRFRQLWSRLSKARDLIALGAYTPGHDAELDLAVRSADAMRALLQQDMHDASPLDASVAQLRQTTSV